MRICLATIALTAILATMGGCSLSRKGDPTYNEKSRYAIFHSRGMKALDDVGATAKLGRDYKEMEFTTQRFDPTTRTNHLHLLCDYVKTTNLDGPDHFVVGYNTRTKAVSLYSDLRSNVALDRLPWSASRPASPNKCLLETVNP